MSDEDEQRRARERDEEDRERFAIRKEEAAMAAEERALEQELRRAEDNVEQAEHAIDRELRKEHWGHDPDRLPPWRTGTPRTERPDDPPERKV